jgi:hypothetical protein
MGMCLELGNRTDFVFEAPAVACRKARLLPRAVDALRSGFVTPRAGRALPVASRLAPLTALTARAGRIRHIGREMRRSGAWCGERRGFVHGRVGFSEEA